ncbi:MAG: glycosyl transferase [Flavobacteriales bacterium CG_4_9_14_3_um_filter_40_17]|nr:MAG: glycosyl transferase [Flavobacteriales bacterium CG_4_9_14_3_um_filter_40_17]
MQFDKIKGMITVIYPYRNRDLKRVRHSLDSLVAQTESGFEVVFVNYGSTHAVSEALEKLLAEYSFVKYVYHPTMHQLWSKCVALNSIIKTLPGGYCFIADVDLIFSPDFIFTANQLLKAQKLVYFQVGFLSQNESKNQKQFSAYKIRFKSEAGATGLSLFPLKALQEVGGFDEFFHFWGAEDTDLHNRLALAGYQIEFYNQQILMLHQWHPSYRSLEQNRLTVSPRLSNVARLNHQHLQHNLIHKIIHPNTENWGKVVTKKQTEKLENYPETLELSNKKEVIDHFLFVALPNHKDGILSVSFSEDVFKNTLKYKLKKWLGKPVPHYYSLKEINDKLLLHLISFYKDFPYKYKVSDDLKTISFRVMKEF